MEPIFFKNQAALREWFERNHATETELLIGYYKTATGRDSVTWSQSVDEALCFGWIDSIRRSIDAETYCNRFTPRRPGSNWSALNIRKVNELTKKGQMHAAGLKAFSLRKENRSRVYSYETSTGDMLSESMVDEFRLNPKAWKYYESQAPSYRNVTTRWVLGAKQDNTRIRRLQELIDSCEAGEWIRAMRWGKKNRST